MRAKLQHLRPQLLETSEQTLKLMIKIEQDTVEVEARKEVRFYGLLFVLF
jgi:dynein heavy chain, axonemal